MATISIQFRDEKSKAGEDVVDIRIVSKTKLNPKNLDKFTRAQRMALRIMQGTVDSSKLGLFGNSAVTEVPVK